MKHTHIRKPISVLLSLLLVLSVFGGVGTIAKAAEPHTHDEITFAPWESTDSLPADAGSYVLTDDVTVSATWAVPAGETNLCLNGKTINANGGNFAVITIGNGCTLNLYDPEGGGIITGANHTADGGGVAITNGGHFNMYGGSIEGNCSTNGGGVSVNGSNAVFHMYGGSIQYNEGYSNTGGILLGGSTVLTLSGGTIHHNAGKNFGGIGTYQGTIVIDGDVNISDNYIYSGGTANKITKSEGAYSLDTTGGQPANVKTAHANDRIKVTNQLTLTHKIGIIRQGDTGVFTTGYTTSGNNADPSEYFYSDAIGYSVTLDTSGEATLSPIYIRMGTYNGLDVDWFTAGSNGNGLMMVSKYALKNMTFGANSTYSSSNIHNWLEGTFATELGLTEKELSLAETLSLQYGDGTDKFVIPSYEEFNGRALTKAYFINDPSTVAPAYWFRTSRSTDTVRVGRYQYETVDMRYSYVSYTEAVRPMFYLDTDAFSGLIMAGSGTETDPYVVEIKHSINNDISSDAASVLATVNKNGTTIYDAGLPTKTIADTEVTFSVTPNEGYIVSNVKLNDEELELTDNQDGTYSFVMPAKNIRIAADVEKERFDVTWKNDDGSTIDTTTVEYGDTPTHADPEKAEDAQYTYTFAGWTPSLAAVTGDATYTATYTTSPSPASIVIDKINAIGTVELTDVCKEKIDAAREAFDALTDTQKSLVTNVETLTNAETDYAALQLANAKADAKDELDAYKNADDYRDAEKADLAAAIAAGKTAIDDATDTEAVAAALANAKASIDAIKTAAELTAEEEAAEAAANQDEVSARIDAIGEVAYTDESKAKIDAARAAYDALTDAQKALVENYRALTAAEAKYAELKAAAETPDDPETPDEPAGVEKPHGEHCFCYKWEDDSPMASVVRTLCGFLNFVFFNLVPNILSAFSA